MSNPNSVISPTIAHMCPEDQVIAISACGQAVWLRDPETDCFIIVNGQTGAITLIGDSHEASHHFSAACLWLWNQDHGVEPVEEADEEAGN